MAVRREFTITGINDAQATAINAAINSMAKNVSLVSARSPSDNIFRLGVVADRAAALNEFLAAFRADIASRLGRDADTDVSRDSRDDMHVHVRI